MEGQSFASFIYNNGSSSTIDDHGLACNFSTFDSLDPYIEKVRSLFVPSLEPLIYNCLETFVYQKDGRSTNPRLKRCLETAATWQEPIEAFCTRMSNEGFLENILCRAIEFLVKGGLIDCLLNSIILNNRLNKVCQDLDELGIERDLLRYLTVWNYINEKDYWVDGDPRATTSMFRESYEMINRTSDLDVEIDSKLCDNRDRKIWKKSLKRRATDDSSIAFEKDNNFTDNSSANDRTLSQDHSWLSIDSSNRKKSNVKERKKSISRTVPCRPSNCPVYRLKYSRRNDCEGKFLKLKIFEPSANNWGLGAPRFVKLSKLRFPCAFEDLMSKLMSTTLPELYSMSRRKTFEANVINLCHRINEILRKADKNGIKRCKLYCEIFPNHLTFRLIKREPDGCKIALLTEIILFNKNGSKSRSDSRGSSFTQLRNVTDISRESGLSIYESALFDLDDDTPQRAPSSQARGKVKQNLSDSNFKSKNSFHSRERNKNDVEAATCHCDTLVHDNFDLETQNDFQIQKNESTLKELAREESLKRDHSDILVNDECMCNESFNQKSDYIDNKLTSNGKINDIHESKPEHRSIEGLADEEPLFHSTAIDFQNPVCPCNDSFDDKSLGHRTGYDRAKLMPKKSFTRSTVEETIDPTCHCNDSTENVPSKLEPESMIGINQINDIERRDKSVEDIFAADLQDPDTSFTVNAKCGDKKSESVHSMLKRNSAIDNTVIDTRSTSINVKSVRNSSEENKVSISCSKIVCECPADCTCTNKNVLDGDSVDGQSQCSCDTCDDVEPIKSPSIRDLRMANFSKVIETRKKENCIENQTNAELKSIDVSNNCSEKSLNSLKPIAANVLSRSFGKETMKNKELYRADWASGERLENTETGRNSSGKNSPVITTRLPRSKGRKISISIELCSESDPSMGKMINDCLTTVPALENDTKKMENFNHTRYPPRCHSFDRNPTELLENQFTEKNTNHECLSGTNRMHSSPRPSESKNYLPSSGWDAASMRNSNVYVKPMKSDIRSNAKFAGRSMSRVKKTVRQYESGEFKRSIDDNERCKENIHKRILPDRNDESSRSPLKSGRFSNSFITGHLCHAFSAGSVDKMRHLIKRKLRRILLERDKATNTPKTILTNERYRVSVPNGKIERNQFPKNYCRTIWESRSASDSVRSSRSFATENHSGIRDRENILHLLYKSTKQSHSQDSDCSKSAINSIDSSRNLKSTRRVERRDFDTTKNCTRLAGGSDVVPREKKLGSAHYLSSMKRQPQSLKKEYRRSYDCEDNKLWATSNNCKLHAFSQKESPPNGNSKRKILKKKYQGKLLDSSEKLDFSGNSTSRHSHPREFAQCESSSTDESVGSLYWRKINSHSLKKFYFSEVFNAHVNDKPSRMKKISGGKNTRNSHPRRIKFSTNNNNNNVSRSTNGIKNSILNINTMDSQQKGFNYLDYDLRSKLSQYVSLCKNVKYSLLKRLRSADVYDVEKSSTASGDRRKMTES